MKNRHGGNIDFAKQLFPQVTFPWLDLSTGINPFSYPIPLVNDHLYKHLPIQTHEERLREIAAHYYGCLSKDYVAIAPGTQILITLMPYLLSGKEVCILCPTYSEYLLSWQQAGIKVQKVFNLDTFMEFAHKPQSIGIICNPNNPDGRLLSKEQLNIIIRKWGAVGNYLIIDEAYMDFIDQGMASYIADTNLIILRSFGKSYGLAGLRLGFLLAQPKIIQKIQCMLGNWVVSGPALQIASQALQDKQWFIKTKRQLEQQQSRLGQIVRSVSLFTVGKTLLFRLVEYQKAQDLWKYLALRGIWVRSFDYNSMWLRFGLPHEEQGWQRLEQALTSYFREDNY